MAVFLPAGTGDKLNYTLTVLLGFVFSQAIVATYVPKVQTAPILADYVMQALFLSAVNLGFVVIVTGINSLPEGKDPPIIIRLIGIRILGFIICKCCCKKKKQVNPDPETIKAINSGKEGDKIPNNENVSRMAPEGNTDENVQIPQNGDDDERETWQEFARNLNILFTIIYAGMFIAIIVIMPYRVYY